MDSQDSPEKGEYFRSFCCQAESRTNRDAQSNNTVRRHENGLGLWKRNEYRNPISRPELLVPRWKLGSRARAPIGRPIHPLMGPQQTSPVFSLSGGLFIAPPCSRCTCGKAKLRCPVPVHTLHRTPETRRAEKNEALLVPELRSAYILAAAGSTLGT
ncbi:hypothetical protein MRX96_027220 [Rhipicephalus microplus]